MWSDLLLVGVYLCRESDGIFCLCRLVRRPFYTQLPRCNTTSSPLKAGEYQAGVVLDEGLGGVFRQRHFMFVYHGFCGYLLFSICAAGGREDDELYGFDYWGLDGLYGSLVGGGLEEGKLCGSEVCGVGEGGVG